MAAVVIGPDGFLPPGRQRCTDEELHAGLVGAFPGSARREDLYNHWLLHRAALAHLVPIAHQWINGSFVTGKEDPNDVDVVSFFDGPANDALPQHLQMLVDTLLRGPYTKEAWRIDSYGVAVYPQGHPQHRPYLAARGYWDWWWGRVRDDDGMVKGYLEVVP